MDIILIVFKENLTETVVKTFPKTLSTERFYDMACTMYSMLFLSANNILRHTFNSSTKCFLNEIV